MTPESQPGDSDARKRVRAMAQAARKRQQGVEAAGEEAAATDLKQILDKNEKLPDAMALRRLYKSQDLIEKLPETVEAPAPAEAAPPAVYSRGSAQAGAPMSPAEVRRALQEMGVTAAPVTMTEVEPRPDDVLPLPEEEAPEDAADATVESGTQALYVVGVAAVLMIVLAFLWVAFLSPPSIRHVVNPGASPSPTVSASPVPSVRP